MILPGVGDQLEGFRVGVVVIEEALDDRLGVSDRSEDSERLPDGGDLNLETDLGGQKRSNYTHASTTDPEARPCCKGSGKKDKKEKLCLVGRALVDNTIGLLVAACMSEADRALERS